MVARNTAQGTACAGENLSVTADTHNWIHTSGTDYQYDAAGNMTRNVTPTMQTYTYDQENRLTGTAGYAYTYDSDGNRVGKLAGSTGTLYWYMTPGIVGESDLNGNLTDEYIFFGGERVARKSTNGVFYYFSDHLKTASVVTDAAGTIKAESDYYPWGGELQFVANDSNHYKFAGKERDSETQLDYFGARYYGNAFGRFTSTDPIQIKANRLIDPQRLNLYVYARSNPLTYVDPDGKDAIAIAFQDSHYAGAGAIFGNKLWSFGHAGVVTVNSKGNAVYYDKNGSGVHREKLGDFKVDKNGKLSNKDTASIVQKLSKEHGESGETKFAYFKANEAQVNKMNQDADKRADATPAEKYSGTSSNCATFVGNELKDGNLATSDAVTPNGMLGDVQSKAEFTGTLKDASDKSRDDLVKQLDQKDKDKKAPK